MTLSLREYLNNYGEDNLHWTLLRGDRDIQRALKNKDLDTGMFSVDLLDAFVCWWNTQRLNTSISCIPNHVWSYIWRNLRPFTTAVDEFVLHKREMFASNIFKLYFEGKEWVLWPILMGDVYVLLEIAPTAKTVIVYDPALLVKSASKDMKIMILAVIDGLFGRGSSLSWRLIKEKPPRQSWECNSML
ncbi:hypothetical protein BVRB_033610, partial [Beta vulgaris subsp. vulgaris]